ncbi:hypothetical protein FRC10_006686 [Ceratobasidium sp. 414]|nr:hypothetical protein FRC10_006686 [Ceratobasidium sp. 414]
MVNIPLEDLRPSPEFEADIRDALSKDSKAERFQEVYKIFELGASVTITDTEKRTEKAECWWVDQNLLFSRTGKISTKFQGGKLQAMPKGNITAWMSQDREYISDVIVWNDANGVCAVQFVTTQGKISPHYGGNKGTPIILSSGGGVLAEFAEITRDNEANAISRIQCFPRRPGVTISLKHFLSLGRDTQNTLEDLADDRSMTGPLADPRTPPISQAFTFNAVVISAVSR